MLLAQAVDPEAAKEIGQAIAKGVAAGLEKTAETAPTNWVQMIVAGLGFVLAGFMLWLFLKDRRNTDAFIRQAQQDFFLQNQQARTDCHEHSKEIVTISRETARASSESSGKLESVANDIKGAMQTVQEVVKDIKATVHDQRNLQQRQEGVLSMALQQLGKPSINQLFGAPQNIIQKEDGTAEREA